MNVTFLTRDKKLAIEKKTQNNARFIILNKNSKSVVALTL